MSPPSAYRSAHPLSAAKPTRTFFDAWNSSSTGHQRAENRLSGSTSWRDSRTAKLGAQFKDGQRGRERKADIVGAGSEGFGKDGRLENGAWSVGAGGLREEGQRSIVEAVLGGKHGSKPPQALGEAVRNTYEEDSTEDYCPPSYQISHTPGTGTPVRATESTTPSDLESETTSPSTPQPPQIFRNLTIYINGSTYPLISDHKLKRLLATHGARISIALGRRSVTHVILGKHNGSTLGSTNPGAGGGLAGTKIQKEVVRGGGGGNGIKYVGVEWVIESVKAGKRLPEARFASLKTAMKGQGSVLDNFRAKDAVEGSAPG